MSFVKGTKVKEKEVVMATDSAKLSKILNALLDVAFEVSGADIGSVMLLDDNQRYLTIKASKGLPDEVVETTKVKMGEGISGLAAKEGKSLLIDDNIRDSRIKSYLNRPQISSSMVLPIKAGERVIGVMNLGALKSSLIRFKPSSERLMNKLVDLVTAVM